METDPVIKKGLQPGIVSFRALTRYHQDTMNRIGEFASNLKTVRGENVKLVAGVRFLRVIADQNAPENFRKTVQHTHVIRYSKDHAYNSRLDY